MDSKLSSRLETVALRLENKDSSSREIDELYNSNSRLLSTSPAEAVCGDSPGDQNEVMGIEDACDINWDDETNITPSGALPMGPPNSFDELTAPTRPETPNYNNELEQLFSTDQNSDVYDYATPGVCGLGNLGNTCFMNSGLQCIMNTPAIVQTFLNHGKDVSHTDTLATHFANLLQKVWSGKYSKVKPSEFQQAFANQHPQFKDYRQHDCQEFLALLLGSLHELLNTASGKSHVSDLSADPMTPRSVGEESAVAIIDAVETDSTSQMALSIGGRCEGSSSSSRSSESSITASHIRLRPLPSEVQPFKATAPPVTPLWEPMDSDGEKDTISDECQEIIATTLDEANSNVIQQDALKRDSKMTNLQAPLNNAQPCLDIYKDAKTSNINVLVADPVVNNEIVFDSDKFPKNEISRRRDMCDSTNLTGFHNFYGKTVSVKRIKETNKLQDHGDTEFGSLDNSSDFFTHTKRFKLQESLDKEKNVRMELERKFREDEDDAGEFSGAVALNVAAAMLDDDMEAEKQWEKHLNLNQSIIVESFQGQFKSTVVCSECQHVSSTYEPFMYLSVPLPHAMELQLCVTFVPASSAPPTKFLLTLNKQEKVQHIKDKLRTMMEVSPTTLVEIAEVLHHHIARFLDENHQVRYLAASDSHRSIYAFEIADDVTSDAASPVTFSSEPLDLTNEEPSFFDETPQLNNLDKRKQDGDAKISSFTNNLQSCAEAPDAYEEPDSQTTEKADEPKSCAICFEEVDKQFKNHKGCSCFLCDCCMEGAIKHYNEEAEALSGGCGDERDQMKCPVCRETVSASSDFVDAEGANDIEASLRILRVPVLFRMDRKDDELNSDQLFGHPHLIKVASRISGSVLHKLVRKLVPYHSEFSIALVDGQGYHCSRCMYNAHCKGCIVAPDAEINLKRGDNLAVAFSQTVEEIEAIEHSSLRDLRKNEDLTLYDCLNAFCESETLDEANPWYCPTCNRNQCATKTLSVWRYPDFLIVYLKRFVFHEFSSVKLDNKVSFPLVDLDLSSSSIHQGLTRRYDLYACVNHLGGASAGHYTAYAKHPRTGDWHLFNDDTVSAQLPQEGDYAHAYVLFYQKQGLQPTSNMFNSYLGSSNIKANMDQLRFDFESSDSKCRKPFPVESL